MNGKIPSIVCGNIALFACPNRKYFFITFSFKVSFYVRQCWKRTGILNIWKIKNMLFAFFQGVAVPIVAFFGILGKFS